MITGRAEHPSERERRKKSVIMEDMKVEQQLSMRRVMMVEVSGTLMKMERLEVDQKRVADISE